MSFDASVLTGQIDHFLQSARKLEADLDAEKKRSQKIAVEYVDVRGKLEKGIKILQAQIQQRDLKIKECEERAAEKESSIGELKASLEVQRKTEVALHQRNQETIEQARASQAENEKYKKAWAQAQVREAEARKMLSEIQIELQTTRKNVEAQRVHIEQLKEHADAYRSEIRKAHARVQEMNTKLRTVHGEYEKLMNARKSADAEVKRTHAEIARLMRVTAEQREEIARRSSQDQLKQQSTDQENGELRDRVKTLQGMMHAEGERMRLQIQTLTGALEIKKEAHASELQKSTEKADRFEVVNIRNQEAIHDLRSRVEEQDRSLNLLRLENSQLLGVQESTRKNLNKQLIVERLRFEAEIERLCAIIENLERADIRIQRIDSDEIDGEIFEALPYADARSSSHPESPQGNRSLEMSN